MAAKRLPLHQIKVASPCTASWDAMTGDDHVRFCGQCSKHVYNLSAMSEEQAAAKILEHEGSICVRFYRRVDGTMLTADCPVGWRAARRRIAILCGTAAGLFLAIFSFLALGALAGSLGNNRGARQAFNPIQRIRDWLFPPPPCVMGKMAPPPMVPPPPPIAQEQ